MKIFTEDPGGQFGGGAPLSASVFETAILPARPTSPNIPQNTAIGGLLGIMLGVGMAFLLERLDSTIKSREDAEKALTPLTVLAQVPVTKRGREVFIETDPFSHESEALRILRTNLHFFSVDRPVKSVLVTSPAAQDGKSTVAVNLATAMAAMGSRCLLIETDLRKPILDQFFDVNQTPGLSDVLSGRVEPKRAIRATTVNNLWILPAGTLPPNPSDILGSQRMVSLLEQLESTADVIVLDSPPVRPVTDAAVLAPHVDGVVMVIKSGKTTKEAAREAINSLVRLDARVLGVVLNHVEHSDGYYYQYYYRRRRRQEDPDTTYDFLMAPDRPGERRKNQTEHTNGQSIPSANGKAPLRQPPAEEPIVAEEPGT
ncbi:MAG: polysaccharide biosynthesis tyrosine autokinase [Actinomycetota bacterium]